MLSLSVWSATLAYILGLMIMATAFILATVNPRNRPGRQLLYVMIGLVGLGLFVWPIGFMMRDTARFRQTNESGEPATSMPASQPRTEVISNATRALRPIQERYEQPITVATLEIMDSARRANHPAPPP